jgi:hypothetical protein
MIHYFSAVRLAVIGFAAFGFMYLNSPSYSQGSTADIRIEILSGGFIIGASGGNGSLFYQGREYPLGIGGLSIGATIGLAKTELVGRVYNLRKVSDIAGTYTAREAGLAIAGGKKYARLRNTKGVVLRLRGRQIGLEATVDLSGMELWLK